MTTLTETNSIHRSPLLRALLLIPLLLACFALLPTVQAAPDPAAIPGGNTRDGAGSLASRTTGINNSAFGTNALNKLTMGNNNAAQGNSALVSLIDGNKNTGLGVLALRLNIHGDDNTAVGYKALYSNTGDLNVAVGTQALFTNTTGVSNTATGFQALFSNSGSDGNTAVGFQALVSNTGGFNTAVGDLALLNNAAGSENTAVGDDALFFNTVGDNNTAVGESALFFNTGSENIALGISAGGALTTGSFNIDIGNEGVGGESSTIRIGDGQAATYIAGISGVNEGGTVAVVTINGNGQLGTQAPVVSSRRFKKDIKPMDQASEAILRLKPVTFDYKSDSTSTPQFGLIAEEVAEVNPDLIARDDKGEIYTVRYEAVNAMLLNEFLKEHRTVQELKSTVAQQEKGFQAKLAEQQKQIEALTTDLQKVSDQLELSRPAPQVVGNNR